MAFWNCGAIRRVLDDRVMSRGRGIIVFPELATLYPATFVSRDKGSLELEIYPRHSASIQQTASFCCVTFQHKFKPQFFVSSVRQYRKKTPPRPPTVIIEMPTKVFTEPQRAAFRVPVLESAGLIVRASSPDGRIWYPLPINLSLSGALLTFPEDVPDFPLGAGLDIALMLDTAALSLAAEVRRRDGNSYGVEFSSVFDETGLNPPETLLSIVAMLEKKWFGRQMRQTAEAFFDAEAYAAGESPRAASRATSSQLRNMPAMVT